MTYRTDERTEQLNQKLMAGLVRILLLLLMGSMVLKLFILRLPAEQALTEFICIAVAGAYLVLRRLRLGLEEPALSAPVASRRRSNLMVSLLLTIPEAAGTYSFFDKKMPLSLLAIGADFLITFLVLSLADRFWRGKFQKKQSKWEEELDRDENNLD